MASWICLAVHPPTAVPPCSSTSISRIMRASWILMPGNLVVPTVIGSAKRCVAQEGGELFVVLDKGVLEIGPEYMMAMLDLLQRGVGFALQLPGDTAAEDFADPIGGDPPQPNQSLADHFAGESVGSPLQGRNIVHGQEGVIVLAVADLAPVQFLLNKEWPLR